MRDRLTAPDLGGEVVDMISKDGFDHTWWGSHEVYLRKMAITLIEKPYDSTTATSFLVLCSSALKAGYIVFKDKNHLTHAISLYETADSNRSNDDQGMAKSCYSINDFYDELFYANNWMYMATGEHTFFNLNTINFKESGFCWYDHSQAETLLYAINPGKEELIE